ncbi:hypothetical protein PCANC_01182 [Puccinia coronata f. sp. avenae]|uniref:Uncharacterized protein n=1 Tax=Puccinia coronata f. sp. avenae TaxID=200324 RepID=A0A2N5W604_9BASI|nr:hypothetical protein PCANC_01182 [Puccinia coronata f. sp. avenae]
MLTSRSILYSIVRWSILNHHARRLGIVRNRRFSQDFTTRFQVDDKGKEEVGQFHQQDQEGKEEVRRVHGQRRQARKANNEGDFWTANALLRALSNLYPPTALPLANGGEQTTPLQGNQICNPPQSPHTSKIIKEGTFYFAVGVSPSHGFCGLPACYNKNIKALKGLIPLTIFDPLWQQCAVAHSAEKQTVDKGTNEERQYMGHPPPDEWSQTYSKWSRNYQFFQSTLCKVYNFTTLAEWIRIHKDRFNSLMRQNGFCAGFRYNLAVRTNTFQCETFQDREVVFTDIYWSIQCYTPVKNSWRAHIQNHNHNLTKPAHQ